MVNKIAFTLLCFFFSAIATAMFFLGVEQAITSGKITLEVLLCVGGFIASTTALCNLVFSMDHTALGNTKEA